MKKLLISLICVVVLAASVPSIADPIDDAIICPGLRTILELTYHWEMVA